MPLSEIDFVIEIYCYELKSSCSCRYQFIPVGTTAHWLGGWPPDYRIKGKLKPGHTLPLDYPISEYSLDYLKIHFE